MKNKYILKFAGMLTILCSSLLFLSCDSSSSSSATIISDGGSSGGNFTSVPSTLDGLNATYRITSATYSSDLGTFDIIFGASSYSTIEGTTPYSYTRTGANSGRLVYGSTPSGYSGVINFTYTTNSSGIFTDNFSGPQGGTNTGTFSLK